MQRPDILSLTCLNPECQLVAQPGQNNLKVREVYGPDQLRFLHSKECGEEFSERRGSALFNTKIPEAKDTVARLLKVAGRQAQKFQDRQVEGIAPQALEFDEQWSYVGKKEKHCTPEERECGDTWDHVAIDPSSKLVVSLEVGERTQEQTLALLSPVDELAFDGEQSPAP